MPMRLEEAKKMCQAITVATLTATGWKHAMEGHYDFNIPGKQPNPEKSYFTIGTAKTSVDVMGNHILMAIEQHRMHVLKGNADDANVVMVYRDFRKPIGRSSNHVDCNIMKVVLGRDEKTKQIFVKSCYPVSTITGTDLK